jgi:bifunctional DNA-binding transcriptional regulator/antitoxin component of YhaV-PrlF toxin-antitoxin module
MSLTKVRHNFQVTIPKAARTAAGIRVGDVVEAVPHRQGVLLKAKTVVDKDLEKVSAAYRRAKADAKTGRLSGPFDTADDLVAHLHRETRRRRSRKR